MINKYEKEHKSRLNIKNDCGIIKNKKIVYDSTTKKQSISFLKKYSFFSIDIAEIILKVYRKYCISKFW